MTIYEIIPDIEKAWEMAIDPETGEILNEEALENFRKLELEKEEKIENTALFFKNTKAEMEAVDAEQKALAKRVKSLKNRMEWAKSCLEYALSGETWKSSKVIVSYRKSESVNISDMSLIPEEYLRYKEPEVDKTAVKNALKSGDVPGAELIEKQNIQIK